MSKYLPKTRRKRHSNSPPSGATTDARNRISVDRAKAGHLDDLQKWYRPTGCWGGQVRSRTHCITQVNARVDRWCRSYRVRDISNSQLGKRLPDVENRPYP